MAHGVAERFFSIEHLEVDDSDAPDIDFGSDDCSFFFREALGGQVPIGADSL